MNHNKEVGALGEQLAKEYLVRQGYKVLEQNLKTSYKEVDLIVGKKNLLVFVEVKTRTSRIFGGAEDTMTGKKIRNLKQAAGRYLNNKKVFFKNIRFDFIAVDIDSYKKTSKISHYQDII